MTEAGFERLMNLLEGVFGLNENPKVRDAFWVILENDNDETIILNARNYIRSERARYGFPKPGDLLDHPDIEGEAMLAWQAAQEICLDLWDTVDLSDDPPLASTIDRMGGRARLHEEMRHANDYEFRCIQKDFERTYRAMRGDPFPAPRRLLGTFEEHNLVAVPGPDPDPEEPE